MSRSDFAYHILCDMISLSLVLIIQYYAGFRVTATGYGVGLLFQMAGSSIWRYPGSGEAGSVYLMFGLSKWVYLSGSFALPVSSLFLPVWNFEISKLCVDGNDLRASEFLIHPAGCFDISRMKSPASIWIKF